MPNLNVNFRIQNVKLQNEETAMPGCSYMGENVGKKNETLFVRR